MVLPLDCPKNVMNLKWSPGQFPVYFFGTHDYNWVDQRRVFRYEEGDHAKGALVQAKSRGLDKQFILAVNEVKNAHEEYKKERAESIKNKHMKPPMYIKIKVNQPVGNVPKINPNLDLDHLTKCECDSKSEAPCSSDTDCLNRLLMYECNPSICTSGDSGCKNRRFKNREEAPAETFYTGSRGWGLRAKEPIKNGTFVVEYVGELIDDQECNRRLEEKTKKHDNNFYFLTIDKDRIIDAGPKGNNARFMNHSCRPNCVTQKWTVNDDIKIGLFATEDIEKGNVQLWYSFTNSLSLYVFRC